MKRKKQNKQTCIKSVCVDKTSYKLTRVLLDELYNNAAKAKQDPCLELLFKIDDKVYYKLRCTVEKVKL
jgi:hypothetical protein